MHRFAVATLFVILPIVLSAPAEEKQPRSLPLGVGVPSATAATGSLGANYGQQTASSESHDKKNFGVNFSSDRGNSNQYSNTGLQAAASGGLAQGQGYPVYQYQYPQYQYPYYPSPVYPYPQYPVVYPNYGVGVPNVGVGAPNVGVGSQVQLPNVSAGSQAGVQQVPVRF